MLRTHHRLGMSLSKLRRKIDNRHNPIFRAKSGKLKTAFINDACAINCDIDVDRARPLINAAAVFKYQSWLAGYQMNFDTAKSNITKNNLAVGYAGSDFTLHASV
jgi:voltage-dependent anion channel protein 2